VDTWLSNSRPRFVLGRGVIAESRVPAPPIIEQLDKFEDVLCRFFTARVVPMVHELALECAEKTFDTGIVPAVTFAAHAGSHAVGGEHLLVPRGGILVFIGGSLSEPRDSA
jgi:hypothetical protein